MEKTGSIRILRGRVGGGMREVGGYICAYLAQTDVKVKV